MNKYVGNSMQLFDVRQYTMTDGKADGTKVISVWNGGKLSFTVLPGRCLDIAEVRYNGNNMSYITPAGIVNSKYFEHDETNWLRSFAGGFLTTCGLENIGQPNGFPGLTMHGRIANTPCENVSVDVAPDGLSVKIKGTAKEAYLFGCKLTLTREYSLKAGEDKIRFTDTITNHGFDKAPVCALYHMNIGYPLLSEKAKVVIPSAKVDARDDLAKANLNQWNVILPPTHGFVENCFYHTLSENCYGIDNEDINTRMRISFESNGMLDRLVQWRMCGETEYVMGMEAASSTLEGREDAIANGSQKYLEPGQSFVNSFVISFDALK